MFRIGHTYSIMHIITLRQKNRLSALLRLIYVPSPNAHSQHGDAILFKYIQICIQLGNSCAMQRSYSMLYYSSTKCIVFVPIFNGTSFLTALRRELSKSAISAIFAVFHNSYLSGILGSNRCTYLNI